VAVACELDAVGQVLASFTVGNVTLRLYGAINCSQINARHPRCASKWAEAPLLQEDAYISPTVSGASTQSFVAVEEERLRLVRAIQPEKDFTEPTLA